MPVGPPLIDERFDVGSGNARTVGQLCMTLGDFGGFRLVFRLDQKLTVESFLTTLRFCPWGNFASFCTVGSVPLATFGNTATVMGIQIFAGSRTNSLGSARVVPPITTWTGRSGTTGCASAHVRNVRAA